MKRAILLGVAVLFVAGMTMAADIDINSTVSMSGDYSGDILHVGVTADGTLNLDGDLTALDVCISDTTVGASGTVNVGAGLTLNTGRINISAGFMGVLNVEGTVNVTGSWFNYDGNGAQYNPGTGLYGEVHVSGSGQINGQAHFIMGGYSAAWPMVVTISDTAQVNGGVSPMYIGGTAGSATVTMSDSAVLQNTNAAAGYYDNILNIGWSIADSGVLRVESGNTVEFRHVVVKSGGKVEYVLDAAGQACVLTARPEDENWVGKETFVTFEPGSILDLDTSGVNPALLVPGFAVDLATTEGDAYQLRWDTIGTYEAALAADDIAAGWALREKPGDATTLQAYIIPEPTTMALLGLGGLLVALRRRS